jgi:hypothetical protein
MPRASTLTKPPAYAEGTIAEHPDLLGVTIQVVWVTPQMAADWLRLNFRNRTVKDRRTAGLTRILNEGLWMFDGSAIRFNTDGGLMDGQHRLTGIVKSGAKALCLVIKGLDPEVQKVIDTGVPRTVRDSLVMDGIKNSTIVASVARYFYMITLTRDRVPSSGSVTPTNQEVEAVIGAFRDEITIAADFASRTRSQHQTNAMGKLIPSVAAIGYAVFCMATDNVTGREFMERLASGINLQAGDPALLFRNRIQATGSGPTDPKLNTPQQLCLLYQAWNANQSGQPITKLQLPRGALKSGNFPDPAYLKIPELRKRMPSMLIASSVDEIAGLTMAS